MFFIFLSSTLGWMMTNSSSGWLMALLVLSSISLMWCGQCSRWSANELYLRQCVSPYIGVDLSVATLTSSACSLIGPFMGDKWAHAQTESVHQNSVLGKLCFILLDFLFFIFVCQICGITLFSTVFREIGGCSTQFWHEGMTIFITVIYWVNWVLKQEKYTMWMIIYKYSDYQ